ncbi:MAG: DUF1549 and DUF1553 domain-containing protein [Lentisphaeraceae bacterium]|nr:DUF1549 and DUF1553 domain-containing protein [Lentisphaeraceae bacterium]
MRDLKVKFLFCLITLCVSGVLTAQIDKATQRKYSEEITQLVNAKLAENKITPNKVSDDETFVRRVYLDAIGRVPTYNEAREFLHPKDKQKRDKLIDRLLDSPGYVSHNFNYWADVLRATSRMRNTSGQPYINWIKDAIKEDLPYDKFVSELLRSEGYAYEHGKGATGYYFRDLGMPLDNMANTMQIFLGTSMVCAQCHDHPFDRWTQMDFYKLAAFTSGTKANRYGIDKKDPAMKPLNEIRSDSKKDPELSRVSRQFFDVLYAKLEKNGTGLIRLPHDYDYDDAKPFDIIKAGVPYGPQVAINYPPEKPEKVNKKKKKKPVKFRKNMPAPGTEINSRKAFADWATSKENPMFTKVIVNRMWDKYMGAPLVDPLLNVSLKGYGANKELTDALINQMQGMKFSLKEFTRVLLKSKAYQRESITEDAPASEKNFFAGPMLRRLTAEQLWDSLLSLALENPDDKLPKSSPVDSRSLVYEKYSSMKPDQLAKVIREASKDRRAFQKELSEEAKGMTMAATMESMGMSEDSMASSESKYKSTKKAYDKLRNEAKKANKKGDKEKAKDLYAQSIEMRASMEKIRDTMMITKNKTRREFTRASEVESPARPSHFLRRFGQSERDIIDGGSQEASIPQALTLLNGKVEDYLINNQYSFVARTLRDAKTTEEKVEAAYLSILSRKPTAYEQSMFKQRFAKDDAQAQKDIIWVLVNSNEFMFNK